MVHTNSIQIHETLHADKFFFNLYENKIPKMRYLALEEALQRLFVKDSSKNQREIDFAVVSFEAAEASNEGKEQCCLTM